MPLDNKPIYKKFGLDLNCLFTPLPLDAGSVADHANICIFPIGMPKLTSLRGYFEG